jgi:glucose/arabinose dehydrogenase
MWQIAGIAALFVAEALLAPAFAQLSTTFSECPSLTPSYTSPVVAEGWEARLIVDGLQGPRSILFDLNGNLLVVESGHGVVNLAFTDDGGTCLTVASKTFLVNSTDVSMSSLYFLTALTCALAQPRSRSFRRWQDALCELGYIGLFLVL